jgi:MarR family transcriptional regulator, transcriptional regulator for hemolysin
VLTSSVVPAGPFLGRLEDHVGDREIQHRQLERREEREQATDARRRARQTARERCADRDGLELANTAKSVSRAFNDRLAEAGGSVPVWLILSSLKSDERRTQHELARAVGTEAAAGLVRRVRGASDRRAVRVELTDAGEALFQTLRRAVIAFNRDLTAGIGEPELDRLRTILGRLGQNASRS